MKKIVSAMLSGIVLASAAPFAAAADDSIPDNCMYLRPHDSTEINIDSNGTIVLDRAALKKLNYTLPTDVFFHDEEASCWYVLAQVKSGNNFIKLDNIVDPLPTKGDKLPYAYAIADENGNLVSGDYATSATINKEYNYASFTCKYYNLNGNVESLVPYGEKTDSYPLTTVDAKFNMNIPYGEYNIYLLTEPVDFEDQRVCKINSIKEMKEVVPEVRDMKIRIEGANLGDIDNNGSINSIDASLALAAYSAEATGQPHGLNDTQFEAGDIDKNGKISSTDASDILQYYSYVATTASPLDFTDFIKQQKEKHE